MTVATARGSPGMSRAIRVTSGLMMKASSHARKNAKSTSPKKKIACPSRLMATKNSTTVPRARMAPIRRRSRLPGRKSIMALAKPHLLADLGHGGLGERAHALGALVEDAGDARRVRHELHVPLAWLGVVADDPVGQQLLGVDAPGPRGPLALPDLVVVVPEEPVELAHVADFWPARIGSQDALGVGDHRHDLAPDHLIAREDVDRVAERLAHLADAVRAQDDGCLGMDRLWLGERLPVPGVERSHDLA